MKPSESAGPLQFKIHGMDCAEEVAVLKQAVGPIVGGEEHLAFDILNGRMVVPTGPRRAITADVVKAVHGTGMRAEPWHAGEPASAGSTFLERHGRSATTVVSRASLAAGFVVHAFQAWRA